MATGASGRKSGSPARPRGRSPRPYPPARGRRQAGGADDSGRPETCTPSPQPGAFPPPPRHPRVPPAPERQAGVRVGKGSEHHACARVGVRTHGSQAGDPASPRTPASDQPAPGRSRAPSSGTKLRGLSASAGRLVARSPQSPPAATPSQRASGPPRGRRGARAGRPQPLPHAPAALTCSALCGSSGARQPGRRRTGCRRRRCPRPAGSRWWSPHGSAGLAAAAAAVAAAARGGSSRRRRRRGGDQNAAGRIARRLGARERAEEPAGRPRPGEAALPARRRGGEAPAATAAAAQPAAHSAPVPVRAASRRRRLPRLFSSRVPKSWHAPRSGRQGCRAGARSCRAAQKTPTARGDGGSGFASLQCPGLLWASGGGGVGAASAGPPRAGRAAVCVSRSERPRVSRSAGRGRRGGEGGPGRGTRALCSRQRALRRCLTARDPPLPRPPEAHRLRCADCFVLFTYLCFVGGWGQFLALKLAGTPRSCRDAAESSTTIPG